MRSLTAMSRRLTANIRPSGLCDWFRSEIAAAVFCNRAPPMPPLAPKTIALNDVLNPKLPATSLFIRKISPCSQLQSATVLAHSAFATQGECRSSTKKGATSVTPFREIQAGSKSPDCVLARCQRLLRHRSVQHGIPGLRKIFTRHQITSFQLLKTR